ncbi:amino acid adenylation domain-containing protein, partial [Pseudoalteromonas sp. MMG005]|uniref:non-ribosomal peptide synthetase n=1 Tax=Pseudoalteromonas sp. MMG005 TaxID=2822682 RepID=UPI001B3A175B
IDRSGAIKASFSQQRLWLVDKLEGSQHYNVAAALECQGPLEIEALQCSIDQIVARHEVLRTCFEEIEGACYQRVMPSRPVPLEVETFTSSTVQPQVIQQHIDEMALAAFDLSSDLMLRAKILVLSAKRHVLLFTLHHIASDGWSMQLLIKEFNAFYQAALTGEPAQVPTLAIQYGDYAHWQQTQLGEDTRAQLLTYWQARLAGVPSLHALPLDKPRPAKQDFTSGYVRGTVNGKGLAGLKALAQAQGVTLFMVLQGALSVLLSRLSGELDIVLGVPTAGRSESELAPLIGFFINTLVSRTQVDLTESFTTLLTQVKTDTLADYQHQALPFELLVEALNPERSLAYNPVCQVKLVLQNHRSSEDEALTLGDATLTPLAQGQEQVRFDLDLTCSEGEDELVCHWRYQKSLFLESTITEYARCFEHVLDAIVAAPSTAIGALRLYDDKAEQALIARSQGVACDHRRTDSVMAQFAAQAQKTPQRIAVTDKRQSLSYAQLHKRVNQLAHYLQEQEIGVGERVALVLDRDVSLLVGMLGVMTAGASYIPLSPQSQKARLADIFADAGVTQVLVSASLLDTLPISGIDVLMLDEQTWDLSEYEDDTPEIEYDLEESAYVIYTSGSTGKPKGVEISHRGLSDYCGYGLKQYYGAHLAGSYVVTSHAFDIGVPSLYLPLLAGGSVRLAPWGQELPSCAAHLKETDEAQLYRMTPMHAEALLLLLEGYRVEAEHVLVIGGEALTVELAERLQETFVHSQIYNHYGPTETVVGCSLYDVTHNLDKGLRASEIVPIGHPMANTGLYVVDEGGQQQVSSGVGELYVGGPCVAKGYVNDEQKTAAAFVYVPWLGGERLYRTGDRVRRLGSGALQFLGRKDDQVKLRGYRVELGEISSVLREQSQVRQAAVLVHGVGAEAELVGYVVAAEEVEDEGAYFGDLEQILKERLAEYMIPSQWQRLDKMPLTANGKLDKGRLPGVTGHAKAEYAAPEGALEQALVSLWCEVLKREPQ